MNGRADGASGVEISDVLNGALRVAPARARLGQVVEGTLVDGLKARLDGVDMLETLRVGQFVRVRGQEHDFFCLITDIQLAATDPRLLQDPPGPDDDFLRQVLAGTSTYGAIKVQPMLMLPRVDAVNGEQPAEPRPPRTVPVHFSTVYQADESDFARVFGGEDEDHFQLGQPLDMAVPVCVDLRRFVERSNGVFGKSGTGKSFLTRLLLCGVIKSGAAVNLIFDMHSEYGHGSKSEEGILVQGLQQLFGKQQVKVLGLEGGSQKADLDGTLTIGLNEIEVEDVALLQDELRLNATAVETANLLVDQFDSHWIEKLLEMDAEAIKEFVERSGAHPAAVGALKRKLTELNRLGFVRTRVDQSNLAQLLEHLRAGRHVVLEFGRYNQPLHYILVANVITRRIHRLWSEQMEKFLQSKGTQPEPRHLMITIEEAHKFLNPRTANQTIFGTIARELRKYVVTLLVVDQRPSGIDDEVLSQIGTRITCALNDDRDIEAVFSGVSGASHLRAALATLDTRRQAIVLGHAVRMPVVIQCRTYDDAFYKAVSEFGGDPLAAEARQQRAAREYDELFPAERA
jgi:DNA helicase HerA-like ATPase